MTSSTPQDQILRRGIPDHRSRLVRLLAFVLLGCLGCEEGPPPNLSSVTGGGGGENTVAACDDPGQVVLRRLNRVEYDNTVRDLFGDDSITDNDFPEDDIGEGFDNVAQVLSISPLHVEKYERSAQVLTEGAVQVPTRSKEQHFEAEEIGASVGAVYRADFWNFWSNGTLEIPIELEGNGQYTVRVRAFGQQAGDEPVRMKIQLDDESTLTDVEATYDSPQWYSQSFNATTGGHTIRITFVNDYYDPAPGEGEGADRNLVVDVVTITGPRAGVVPIDRLWEAEDVQSDAGGPSGQFWNLWSNGSIDINFSAPVTAEYDLSVRAFGQQAGDEVARMAIEMDGQLVETFDVEAESGAPRWYTVRTRLEAGHHGVKVAFINDYHQPEHPDPAQRDRNLLVDAIRLTGPFGDLPESQAFQPPPLTRVMTCQPASDDDTDCAQQVVTQFAERAWRRPVSADEVQRLMGLVQLAIDQGDAIHTGIQLAVRAILLSPHFTYRVELDRGETRGEAHPLGDHELAARVSYFLWSSMPDDTLRARADAAELSRPDVLQQEVERMLKDEKADALISNFAGQWLFIRAMTDVAPDYNYFPEFDEILRASMVVEAELVFRRILRENRPLPELMDTPITFINERLAEHYGLDFSLASPVDGLPQGFRRFDLSDGPRRGLLGLGSVLTVTSFPTRTSPVKRGKWVLEQLMCDAPPPPPPGVEAELGEVDSNATLRERLAQHRESPQCAGCHNRMDPIGLGMDRFDAIGRFRTMDGAQPIDSSGTLPGDVAFDGVAELSRILKSDDRFMRCVEKRLFTYAVGRSPVSADQCILDRIHDANQGKGFGMADLVRNVIASPAFTKRRAQRTEIEE